MSGHIGVCLVPGTWYEHSLMCYRTSTYFVFCTRYYEASLFVFD